MQLEPIKMKTEKYDFNLIEGEVLTIGMQVSTTRAVILAWLPAVRVLWYFVLGCFRLGRVVPPDAGRYISVHLSRFRLCSDRVDTTEGFFSPPLPKLASTLRLLKCVYT